MCSVCACVYVYIYVYIYIYINTYFMCTYIYVLKFPIFCAIWLKKCDFLTQKLGIKKDPDPKLFIPDPDPDPSKSSGSGSTTLQKGAFCYGPDPSILDNRSVRGGSRDPLKSIKNLTPRESAIH